MTLARARVTCIYTVEIDLNPKNYDKNNIDTEEMIDIEHDAFTNDPERILNFDWDSYTVEVEEIDA